MALIGVILLIVGITLAGDKNDWGWIVGFLGAVMLLGGH